MKHSQKLYKKIVYLPRRGLLSAGWLFVQILYPTWRCVHNHCRSQCIRFLDQRNSHLSLREGWQRNWRVFVEYAQINSLTHKIINQKSKNSGSSKYIEVHCLIFTFRQLERKLFRFDKTFIDILLPYTISRKICFLVTSIKKQITETKKSRNVICVTCFRVAVSLVHMWISLHVTIKKRK